jgi:hypothetical protein
VINKFLQTIGGREKLGQIKDLTMNMSASVQGMALAVVQQRKGAQQGENGDAGTGHGRIYHYFDGKRAVMSQMGNPQEVTGPELEAVKIQNTCLRACITTRWALKRSLTGTETVEGKEAYK